MLEQIVSMSPQCRGSAPSITFSAVTEKGNSRESMFEIQKKDVPDAISYIMCTRTGDVKFGPKVFLWTSLRLVLFTCFH